MFDNKLGIHRKVEIEQNKSQGLVFKTYTMYITLLKKKICTLYTIFKTYLQLY